MIPLAHLRFRRWADWTLSYTVGGQLGYGRNVLARIMEGKGEILPGPPSCSGPKIMSPDPIATKVDRFLCTIPADEKFLIKTFYLSREWSSDEKAKHLKIPARTMYAQLERIQFKLMGYFE